MTRTSECDYNTHTYTHASGNIRKEHAAANNENTLQYAYNATWRWRIYRMAHQLAQPN